MIGKHKKNQNKLELDISSVQEQTLIHFFLTINNAFYFYYDLKKHQVISVSSNAEALTGITNNEFTANESKKKSFFSRDQFQFFHSGISKFLNNNNINDIIKYRFNGIISFRHNKNKKILRFLFNAMFPLSGQSIIFVNFTDVSEIYRQTPLFLMVSKIKRSDPIVYKIIYYESLIKNQYLILVNCEYDIVKYICNGYTNKEIAAILGLSVYTVEDYRKKIYKKLQVKNVYSLIRFVKENQIF